MKVHLHTQEIETQDFKTVKSLLSHLSLIPTTVVVLKNDMIVEITERIRPEDKIEIVKVMSGG